MNDNWQDDANHASQIAAASLVPGNERESALPVTLPAGDYTVIGSGAGGEVGVALLEIYNLQ